jgi:hypothetical protein
MSETLRAMRWANFQSRVVGCREHADEGALPVYQHRTHGWEYIPVHPFGDEKEVLDRLGLRPEDCRMADAWWGIDGDATLLESAITGVLPEPARLFAKATPHEEAWVYLVAVFDAPYVTRAAFEAVMVRFAEAGFPCAPEFQLRWGDTPVQLHEGRSCNTGSASCG